MALAHRQPDPRRRPTPGLGAVLVFLATVSGCQTGSGGFLTAWRMGRDASLSKGPNKDELQDDRNLMARWLSPKRPPSSAVAADKAPSTLILGSDGWKPMKPIPNPEADAEFQAAERLFQQGKLDGAETAFQKLAKNRKGTPWGERGQFYLAETQYQRGKYVAARDSFEKLVSDYPGTEYLDKLVSRQYAIAERWLKQYDPNIKPEEKISWTGHFSGQEPLIDTFGHALDTLEKVRHHDPTGPLADDAVMRIADEHMKYGDYDLAALHYDQLITDHPKSPYLQKAQLAAIDMRIKGYLGPEYDGSGLEKSRELIKQTMATFPDRPAGNEKLYHTLDLINDAEAERSYVIGDYYRRTGKVASAEFYFGKIRQRWPNSPWAAKAKAQLAVLAKMPRKQSLPSKIMTQPGAYDSFVNGGMNGMMGAMGGMNGMGNGMMGAPGGMN